MEFDDRIEQDNFSDGSDLFMEDNPEDTAPATGEEGRPVHQAGGTSEEPGVNTLPEGEQAAEENQPEQAEDDGWRLTIRHNHQDIDLTREEAVTLAQKGRNYDSVAQERDRLRQQAEQVTPYLTELTAWARESGMELGDYMAYARKQRDQAAMEQAVADILSQHPETPEPLARELAAARMGELSKKTAGLAQAQQRQAQEAELAPWRAFVTAYPHILSVADLPQEVFAAIEGGMDPLPAMQKHELAQAQNRIAQLEAENQAYKTNQRNQKKALPSSESKDGGAEEDPFEQGLFA